MIATNLELIRVSVICIKGNLYIVRRANFGMYVCMYVCVYTSTIYIFSYIYVTRFCKFARLQMAPVVFFLSFSGPTEPFLRENTGIRALEAYFF